MPRIFITGSTDGLGRAAAGALMGEGHDVVLHARTLERAAAFGDLALDAAGVVIGDLSSAPRPGTSPSQVNQIGRMDAVIHNAGVFLEPSRSTTADGHAKTFAVNTLAPYLLTALIGRPDRLIYLSSGLHHAGAGSFRDIDWTRRSWNAGRRTPRASSTSPRSHSPSRGTGRTYSATPSIRAGSRPRWAVPRQPAICGWAISRRHGSPSATTQPPP